MRTALRIFSFFLFLILFPLPVSAHQPYLVGDSQKVIVTEPEVSKAYYGEIPGKPVFYSIDTVKPFNFYVNVLVPKLDGIDKDYVLEIYKDSKLIKRLDGRKFSWKEFYEPFGGDTYFKGPEYKASVSEGKYTVIVTSKDNLGKYVVAIGEKEQFGIKEITRTLSVLTPLKRDFFEYPTKALIFSRVGVFYGVFIFLLLGFVFLSVFIVKKYIGGNISGTRETSSKGKKKERK